ncbi:MAG: methionine--tRNA ligase, partial [Candidatus Bathyarchaeia archaeon]
MARYLRLKGEDVVYVSGSDEHGTPIEVEAINRGLRPKDLTDQNHAEVKSLFEKWGISFDNYTRTEASTHKRLVRAICLQIQKQGYVFTEESTLPFCVKCDRFLPDRFIEGECPHCNYLEARGDQCDRCGRLLEPSKLIQPKCAICGLPPEMRTTKHWYFDLPKLTQRLQEYIAANTHISENARAFSVKILEEGLRPRSLTRDNRWGIPAPFEGAEDKTIYVWIEAVLGYVSATMEYFEKKGAPERWREFWLDPNAKTLFFIGKDNIPFHTIILPALLTATGEKYNLPWAVDATEFLMFEGQKFSKSRRIGVWIDEALTLYPVDYWRYALLSMRPENKDTNFTWEVFLEKINSDLNDTLGNFIHRTLTFIHSYFDGKIPEASNLDENDVQTLNTAKLYHEKITHLMDKLELQAAVTTCIDLARVGNKYINDSAPWKLVKTDAAKAASCLYVAAQLVKTLTVLLTPFTPFTIEALRRMLGYSAADASGRWDDALQPLKPGHRIGKPEPLFRKIEASEIQERIRTHAPATVDGPGGFTTEDLAKADLRVGKITAAEPIRGSAKLLKLTVDVGGTLKTAVAGLGRHYSPKELRGRSVVVVANMKPATLLGVTSEVMILAATDGENIAILQPD